MQPGNKTQQLRIKHQAPHLSIRNGHHPNIVLSCKTKFHHYKIKNMKKITLILALIITAQLQTKAQQEKQFITVTHYSTSKAMALSQEDRKSTRLNSSHG